MATHLPMPPRWVASSPVRHLLRPRTYSIPACLSRLHMFVSSLCDSCCCATSLSDCIHVAIAVCAMQTACVNVSAEDSVHLRDAASGIQRMLRRNSAHLTSPAAAQHLRDDQTASGTSELLLSQTKWLDGDRSQGFEQPPPSGQSWVECLRRLRCIGTRTSQKRDCVHHVFTGFPAPFYDDSGAGQKEDVKNPYMHGSQSRATVCSKVCSCSCTRCVILTD